MNEKSIYDIIVEFNHSELRKKMIPQELVSGWPALVRYGKTLCITIPFYKRVMNGKKVALYPIYCSVTVPVHNTDRIMDFTIYPYQKEWKEIDYTVPSGFFKHEALKDIKTKSEYRALCDEFYGYFDQMIQAVENKEIFRDEEKMIASLSRLMEPGLYPQYLKVNQKFYSHFCKL